MSSARTISNLLILATIFGSPSSAQLTQTSEKRNHNFLVDRALVFYTKVIPIGPYSSAFDNASLRWSRTIVAPAGAKQIAIHVKTTRTPDTKAWTIRFKDLKGTELDVVTSDSARAAEGDFWSEDISGNGALVEVYADEVPVGLNVVIDAYSIPTVPSVPQAIYGADQRISMSAVPAEIRKRGTPVARLRIKDSRGEARCTGFLVSDDLIITNFHCISRNSQAVGTSADFGYDSPDSRWKTFRGAKLELVNTDEGLDYSIIRLAGKPGIEFGHVALTKKNLDPLELGSKLLLIEHAEGQAKQASITDCEVAAKLIPGVDLQLLSDFGHHCDTLGGSSGSPVFDQASGELLGLHHLGFDEQKFPSKPKPGVKPQQWDNQAVYIGLIMQDVQKQSQSLFDELITASH